MIYPVLSDDILNDKVGIELDKVFNTLKDRTGEGQEEWIVYMCT